MKRILMLSTGGTIATQETEAGKVPKLSSRALLGAIPELSALCQVDALELFQLDSTNLQPLPLAGHCPRHRCPL